MTNDYMKDWMKDWMEDLRGGGTWEDIRDCLAEHDPDCRSLLHAWMPRLGGMTDPWDLNECFDCRVTFHYEGLRPYELQLEPNGDQPERQVLDLCDCCWRDRIKTDHLLGMLMDKTVSTRFFRWKRGAYDVPWWQLLIWGGEENCNRTLGIKTPWGIVFVCLNVLLRQKPCTDCLKGNR